MKKKITRSSFSALRETAILMDEREKRAVIGRGDYWDDNGYWATDSYGNTFWKRTSQGDGYYYGGSGYYTQSEFFNWSGDWLGGYVEGMGYVPADTIIYGSSGYYGGSGYYAGSLNYGYISYYSGSGTYPLNYDDPNLMSYGKYVNNFMSWELSKQSLYSELANKYNINLYEINIMVSSVMRGANAWIGDNEVFLGDNFFKLSRNQQLRVLVHEYTHIKEDQPWSAGVMKTVNARLPEPPSHIKSYILNNLSEGNIYEYEYRMSINKLADSQYYRNEVNAYMKEQQLFKNLSYNEWAELEYRIWYFSTLANLSDKY